MPRIVYVGSASNPSMRCSGRPGFIEEGPMLAGETRDLPKETADYVLRVHEGLFKKARGRAPRSVSAVTDAPDANKALSKPPPKGKGRDKGKEKPPEEKPPEEKPPEEKPPETPEG